MITPVVIAEYGLLFRNNHIEMIEKKYGHVKQLC